MMLPISTSSDGSPASTGHPLDPLTAAEIRQAVAVLRRDRAVGDRWRFAGIELAEPGKPELAAWRPGDPIRAGGPGHLLEPGGRPGLHRDGLADRRRGDRV